MDFQNVVIFILFGILVGIAMALRLRREPVIHVAPQATATATANPGTGGGTSRGGVLIPVLLGVALFALASQLLSRGAEVPQQAQVPQVESVPQEGVVSVPVPTAVPIPTVVIPTAVYMPPVPEPIVARQSSDTLITKALGILLLAVMGVSVVIVSAVLLTRYRGGTITPSPQVLTSHPLPNVSPPSEPVKTQPRPVWESYAEEVLERVRDGNPSRSG